jgi:hypothetical protein
MNRSEPFSLFVKLLCMIWRITKRFFHLGYESGNLFMMVRVQVQILQNIFLAIHLDFSYRYYSTLYFGIILESTLKFF